ncbi:MAG: ATP-binding protein [Crocinitomicaceae bacterium]|nr:ATP-binding protein [Crocinitomicaceae bacterium]
MSELKQLIASGRNVSLEFFPETENRLNLARTLVAFANTNGGTILIGVDKKGKVVGSNPEEDVKEIQDIATNECFPMVEIESRTVNDGRHLVLEVEVKKSNPKHKSKGDDGQLSFYHRIKDHTLISNRVIIHLWKSQDEATPKPNELNGDLQHVLKLVEEYAPVTISKIFRFSALNKNDINAYLAELIHWELVYCVIVESGVAYSIHK